MSSVCGTKRVSAIVPVNKDCVTFMFKDGTSATFTYRELRDSWNEMNGYKAAVPVPKRPHKSAVRVEAVEPSEVPLREPVAHGSYPKLHPLAKPRTISYES